MSWPDRARRSRLLRTLQFLIQEHQRRDVGVGEPGVAASDDGVALLLIQGLRGNVAGPGVDAHDGAPHLLRDLFCAVQDLGGLALSAAVRIDHQRVDDEHLVVLFRITPGHVVVFLHLHVVEDDRAPDAVFVFAHVEPVVFQSIKSFNLK